MTSHFWSLSFKAGHLKSRLRTVTSATLHLRVPLPPLSDHELSARANKSTISIRSTLYLTPMLLRQSFVVGPWYERELERCVHSVFRPALRKQLLGRLCAENIYYRRHGSFHVRFSACRELDGNFQLDVFIKISMCCCEFTIFGPDSWMLMAHLPHGNGIMC